MDTVTQIKCPTNWATPGYGVWGLAPVTMPLYTKDGKKQPPNGWGLGNRVTEIQFFVQTESKIRQNGGGEVIQDPHQGKARTGVHMDIDPVEHLFHKAPSADNIGMGQGAALGAAEGEQAAVLQCGQHPPGIPEREPRRVVKAVPQHIHQPVGGTDMCLVGLVAIQHDAGYGDVGPQSFCPGIRTVCRFRRAGADAVEIHRISDFLHAGGFHGQFIHELSVLAVGQLRVAESYVMPQEERPADQAAPHYGVQTGDIIGKISLPGQGLLLGGQHLLELVPVHHQPVAVRVLNHTAQAGKHIGGNQIVRIHEPDIIPPGAGQPYVPGGDHAAVLLIDDQKISVFGGKSGEDLAAVVGGAVVDADNLIVRFRNILGEKGVQTLLQIGLSVVHGNNDTQKHSVCTS